MAAETFDDEGARTIRTHWFRYLDTIEPMRSDLFGYCHKLTRNIWDAEDLVQETLLTGFGMTARGDFHGEHSPVRNAKAYLFRSATNRWLDMQRYEARFVDDESTLTASKDSDPNETADALNQTIALTSPQEFVAFLLKDVYDFRLDEIADFVGTTEGTIKSALSRARRKMKETPTKQSVNAAQKQLAEKFVAAMNGENVDAVIALMAEQIQIKVCNVGGGRGKHGSWGTHLNASIRTLYEEVDGMPVVVMIHESAPDEFMDVLRLEGDGAITRLTDYCYAPETLQYVANSIGRACANNDTYHQPWKVIETGMVPTTSLPWHTN